jgi:hypothetical protein
VIFYQSLQAIEPTAHHQPSTRSSCLLEAEVGWSNSSVRDNDSAAMMFSSLWREEKSSSKKYSPQNPEFERHTRMREPAGMNLPIELDIGFLEVYHPKLEQNRTLQVQELYF